jgi:hypothetical protein
MVTGCGGDGSGPGSTPVARGPAVSPPPASAPPSGRTFSGTVSKGPLSGATVTLHSRTSAASDGTVLGSGQTSAGGAFSIAAGASAGSCYISATGGTYVDEATGQTLTYGGTLSGMLAATKKDESYADIQVTPFTHLAVRRAIALGAFDEPTLERASAEVGRTIGLLEPGRTAPALTTSLAATDAPDPAAGDYGLLLGALSQWAADVGTDPRALVDALATDVADGRLDGKAAGQSIVLAGRDLASRPVGGELRNALVFYAAWSRNASRLMASQHLLSALERMDGALADPAAPVASAGRDQTAAEGAVVRLDGSLSTPKGATGTFRWRQISGPSVTLSSEAVATPTFTATLAGEYVFELEVTVAGKPSLPSWTRVSVTGAGARLAVRPVGCLPRRISQGQKFTVRFGVTNSGRRAARASSARPSFRSASGADVAADYTLTGDAANPTALAAGETGRFSFAVAAGLQGTRGRVTVDASAAGSDDGTSQALSDDDSESPARLDVESGANLVIESFKHPATVYQGKTAQLTAVIRNDGEAGALVDAVTPKFTDASGADRTAQYALTPAATNPARIAGGERADYTWTVVVSKTATTGTIGIDGTVAFKDANSLATGSSAGAVTRGSWSVEAPKVVLVDAVSGPARVSPGQSATVNVAVPNATGHVASLDRIELTFRAGGNDRGTYFAVTPSPGNPTTLSVDEQRTLSFTVLVNTLATTGAVTVDARVSFTDRTTRISDVTDGATTPLTWTVQKPASLSISGLSAALVVSRGQTTTVLVTLTNGGEASATSVAARLSFKSATGSDRAADYTVTAAAANPTTIAGGGSATLSYAVVVSPAALLGVIVVDVAPATAQDANSGVSLSRSGAPTPGAWVVQIPAILSLVSVTSTVSTISQGQTFPVTLTLKNDGGATASITSSTLQFIGTGGADRASSYTVTAVPGNPTSVKGGETVRIRFSVAAAAAAPAETLTVDGEVTGTEQNTGGSLSSGPAQTPLTLAVQTPARFEILAIGAPSVVVQGGTANVTMTVKNTGTATAQVSSTALRFTRASGDASADYTVTPVSPPGSIAGGATATFQYQVAISPAAVKAVTTVDGTISGTDANSGAAISDVGATSPATWTVLAPASLAIASTLAPARVSRGQTALATMTLENAGGSAANIASAALTFKLGGTAVDGEYAVTPRAGNPTQVPAAGTAALEFDVAVAGGASLGVVTIDGTASGTDALTGNALSASGAASKATWTVQTPAQLSVTALAAPARVSLGQTARVTVTLSDAGQADATLTGTTLSFAGAVNRNSEYTVTAATGNPAAVPGGGTAQVKLDVAVSPAATRETVSLSAAATGKDANSGAAIGGSGPASPPSWIVQAPAALTVLALTSNVTVASQGQTIPVTLSVRNDGEATAASLSGALVFRLAGADKTGQYAVAASGSNPTQLAGGATGTLRYDVTVGAAASAGAIDVTAVASASDANSGSPVSGSGPASPLPLLVQVRAGLDIGAVTGPPTISQGQTVNVTMTIANPGEAATVGVVPALALAVGGVDRTGQYTRTLLSGPSTITGGTTATYVFSVTASAGATIGAGTVDGQATGQDANSLAAISDSAAASPHAWSVLRSAELSILSILPAPTSSVKVSQGQFFPITMNVKNIGGNPATFTTSTLSFTRAGVDKNAEYLSFARAGNPAGVAVGATVALVFDVQSSGSAQTGAIDIDGTSAALDDIVGITTTASSAVAKGRVTMQTPAKLAFESLSVPPFVSLGQTFLATATAKDTGEADATLTAVAFTFKNGGGTPRNSSFVVGSATSFPTVPGGGGQASISVRVTATSTAPAEVIDVTSVVNGTDSNSGAALSTGGPTTPAQLTLQTPAAFSISKIEAPRVKVSQGQTTLLTATVSNTGQATALPGRFTFSFKDGGAVDHPADYAVTARSGNPTTIPGGASRAFTFDTTVDVTATTGLRTIDLTVEGKDKNSLAPISATGSAVTTSWTVQRKAGLHIVDLRVTPGAVFQEETLFVTMNVDNSGEATARVTSTSLTFTTSGSADTASYQQTPDAKNPASITGGTTAALKFVVSVGSEARLGRTTIDGKIEGEDVNSGSKVSDGAADTTTSAVIRFLDKSGPKILYANPRRGAFNVQRNTRMFVTFDRPVDPATVTTTSLSFLRDGTPPVSLPITSVIRVKPTKQTYEIRPAAGLSATSTYVVLVSNLIKDIKGNPSKGDLFTFSTSIKASSLGTAPPTTWTTRPDIYGYSTLRYNPAHLKHNVPVSSVILARWAGPIDSATVSTASVRFWRMSTPYVELSVDSVAIVTQPTDTIKVVPSVPIAPGTTYAVMLTNNVRDTTGFPVATQDFMFSTTLVIPKIGLLTGNVTETQSVPDDIGPLFFYTNPYNDRYNTLKNSRILFRFNEPVNPVTVTADKFRVYQTLLGSKTALTSIGVSSVVTYTSPSRTFSLITTTMAAALPMTLGTTYLVLMDNRVLDAAGNNSPGYDFRFSCALNDGRANKPNAPASQPTPDTTGPGFRSVNLNFYSESNTVCTPIKVKFNEAVVASTLVTDVDVQLWSLDIFKVGQNEVRGTWDQIPISTITATGVTNEYQITPLIALPFTPNPKWIHMVLVDNRIVDTKGNAAPGETFAFTYDSGAGCCDSAVECCCGNAIKAASPWKGKQNVTLNSRILLTFTDSVLESTITTNIMMRVDVCLGEYEDNCGKVTDFPTGFGVPYTFKKVPSPANTYELTPVGGMAQDKYYGVRQSGYGLRKAAGAFMPCGAKTNYYYFATSNVSPFPVCGGTASTRKPDTKLMHAQSPPVVSGPKYYGTTMVEFIPSLGRENVRTSSRIFVTLDSSIDPLSVSSNSIVLQEWKIPSVQIPLARVVPAPVPGTKPDTFEVVPSVPLKANTTYSVHLTNRATDSGGVPATLDETYFITRLSTKSMPLAKPRASQPTPDTTGPLAVQYSPPRKANVHVKNRVFFTFDEPARASTVTTVTTNFILFTRDVDGPFADVTRSITVHRFTTPANTFEVLPVSVPFAAPATYGVFVTDNVRDTAGAFSGGSESFFETRTDMATFGRAVRPVNVSTSGPFFSMTNPANARSSVQTGTRILFAVCKSAPAATLATGVFLRRLAPTVADLSASVLPITTPVRGFEVIPSAALSTTSTYAVYLTNIVRDGDGRPSPTDEFYFQTQVLLSSVGSQTPATWATATGLGPIFSGRNPANRRFNVQPTTRIFVTFNKTPLDLTDARSIVVSRLTTPLPIPVPISGPITPVSSPPRTYEIPISSASLTRYATYGVFVTNRVSDTLGNPSPGDSFQFTTVVDVRSMWASIRATERADVALHGPVLLSTNPVNARHNLSPDSRILFRYNSAVSGLTSTSVVLLAVPTWPATATAVAGTVAGTTPANTYEFLPLSGSLSLGTTFALCLTNNIQNSDGRHSPGDDFYFSTSVQSTSIGSTIPTTRRTDPAVGPVLLSSNPSNNRMNVQTSTRVLFTFNQKVKTPTVNTASVSLLRLTTPVIKLVPLGVVPVTTGPADTFQMDLASGTLKEATTYEVIINNRVEADDGTRSPGDEFRFGTATVLGSIGKSVPSSERADVARHGPLLLSSNPANGEMNVLPGSRVLFTFNTGVKESTVTGAGGIVFKKLSPPEALLGASVSKIVTPANTFELTPSAAMSTKTTYGVFVTNRVEALDGRASPGDEFRFSTSISLPAMNNPTGTAIYQQVNPAHKRANVMTNTRVLCTFDRALDVPSLKSGGIRFGSLTTDTFTAISVSDVFPVTMPANTYEVTYSVSLTRPETYGVFVTNLAKKLNGEPLPQFYSRFSTTFDLKSIGTTATTTEVKNPTLYGPLATEFNPPHRRGNLSRTNRMFVTLSTRVKGVTTQSVQVFKLTTPVAAAVKVTSPPDTYELVPSASLSGSTTYGIFISNRVRALSDLASPGHDAWFSSVINAKTVGSERYTTTVTSPDLVGPYIKASNPLNGAFNVPLNSEIRITFNESVRDSTIVSVPNVSVKLLRLSTPVIDLGPVTVTRATTPPNTYIIQRVPPADLTPTTTYAVLLANNVEDQVDNHAQPGSVKFSTTLKLGPTAASLSRLVARAAVSAMSLGAGGTSAIPALVITSLLAPDRMVTGEDSGVLLTVENRGAAPLDLTGSGLRFGWGGLRTGQFVVTPGAANPASIGARRAAGVVFSVRPQPGSVGPVPVQGWVTGADAATGAALPVAESPQRTVEVVGPAALSVVELAAPSAVLPGSEIEVRAVVANTGQLPARLVTAGLSFTASTDRQADYAVTARDPLPVEVAGGSRVTLAFGVRVSATAARFETVRVQLAASAVDVRTGKALEPDRQPWVAWIVLAGPGSAGEIRPPGGARPFVPGGMTTDGRRTYLVDSAGCRILVYDRVPVAPDEAPAFVIGGPVGGDGAVGPLTFAGPTAIHSDGVRLALADTGHDRVLVWSRLPAGPDAAPDRALGGAPALRAPAGVLLVLGRTLVADTGHDRVLVYPPDAGDPFALGDAPGTTPLRAPHGMAWDGSHLWVADTGNRRIVAWAGLPAHGATTPVLVLGQPDFRSRGTGGLHPAPAGIAADATRVLVTDREAGTLLAYLRQPGTPLSVEALRSAVLVPYPGGPALAGPTSVLPTGGLILVGDPPAGRVVVLGR